MVVVMRFFRWVRRAWQRITSWVSFRDCSVLMMHWDEGMGLGQPPMAWAPSLSGLLWPKKTGWRGGKGQLGRDWRRRKRGQETHCSIPFVPFHLWMVVSLPHPLSYLSSLCLGSQIFFWRQKMKPTMLEHPASKKHSLKKVKTLQVSETLRLVEPLKEAKLELGESPELPDACVLAKNTEGTEEELVRQGRSLLRLPRTAVKSVSTLMVSTLQRGWQMCSWKVSTVLLFPVPLPLSPAPSDSLLPPMTCSTIVSWPDAVAHACIPSTLGG
nr:uncharacterized protein LOC105727332 [Aotus nancymaae]